MKSYFCSNKYNFILRQSLAYRILCPDEILKHESMTHQMGKSALSLNSLCLDSVLRQQQFNRCLSELVQLVDSVAISRLRICHGDRLRSRKCRIGRENITEHSTTGSTDCWTTSNIAMQAQKKRGSFPIKEAKLLMK